MPSPTDQFAHHIKQLSKVVATDAHVRKLVGALLPEFKQAGVWMRHYETERHELLDRIKVLERNLSTETWLKNQIHQKYIAESIMIDEFLNEQILFHQERLKELTPAGEPLPPELSKEALEYMSVKRLYSSEFATHLAERATEHTTPK